MKRTYPTSKLNRTGFTLIELLVVISIISLLISILLPSLSAARARARQVKCAANLKQFGVYFVQYAADNKDQTPLSANQYNTLPTWFSVMGPMMGPAAYDYTNGTSFSIWQCPENNLQIKRIGTAGGEEQGSYMINGWGYTGGDTYTGRFTDTRFSDIYWPSTLYAMLDGANHRTDVYPNDGQDTVPFVGTGVRYVRYAHMGQLEMLYADAHVATLKGPLAGRDGGSGTYGHATGWNNGKSWWSRP